MKNITVLGCGVLGSQIAFQTAFCDYQVTIFLRSKESLKRAKGKLIEVKNNYISALEKMKDAKNINDWSFGISDYDSFNYKKLLKKINENIDKIKLETNLEKSIKDADLVIESMSEDVNLKRKLFKSISPYLKADAIVVTNSSSLIPSRFVKSISDSSRFLALHFANSIWKNNTAEVMMHKGTTEDSFNKVLDFAKSIRMVALPIKKEKAGYLLNSMLIPFLFSAMDLVVNGVSDVKSIDEAWTRGTGAPHGPFEILDIVGLKTAHDIVLMYVKIPSFLAPYNFKAQEKLLSEYIEEGKLGKSVGEGFYKY